MDEVGWRTPRRGARRHDDNHRHADRAAPVTSPTSTSTSTSAAAHDADSLRPVTPDTDHDDHAHPLRPPPRPRPRQRPAQTENLSGSLQQPDLSTASYPFSGVGSMQVSASWSPASTTLSVTVTCPAGTLTEEATTTLTVAIPDADGACEATIKETSSTYEAVSYTLTIGPTQGG